MTGGSSLRRAAGILAGLGLFISACGEVAPDNNAFISALTNHQAAEVTVAGKVTALLPDSNGADGPHQDFDLDVSGYQVEVDHNLTLAPRVPLQPGETVVVHGQFEPDPGHPVIHYTHHATGRHEGGYIIAAGRTYR